jgi:hypothetical protein
LIALDRMKLIPTLLYLLGCAAMALAQSSQPVKPIPPPGIEVPEEVRASLTQGVTDLAKEIEALRAQLAGKPELLAQLPDVEIFHKAVDWALSHGEFFDVKQFEAAQKQIALGKDRARALREGEAPWNKQTGLVVRGYRSKIDGSVQPYGLVIPEAWKLADRTPRRLDFWFHGRAEKLSELAFLDERMTKKGEFAPENALVLHLYGRYCNANKFAGEVDLFEAWEHARSHYVIDPSRVVVRGFSMGGAAAWQFATHFSTLWAAAAPGAGFAETAEFFKVFAPGKTPPPWWEQVLWRWYDATLYAGNLSNVPTVAYSGEKDGQKQAADIMLRYAAKEGLTFPHVIGPGTAHKYHPDSKPQIEEFIGSAAANGRDEFRKTVRLTTYNLIYPKQEWLEVTGLQKHWERAEVQAKIAGGKVAITTSNVTGIRLGGPFGDGRAEAAGVKSAVIDGEELPLTGYKSGVLFHYSNGRWANGRKEMKKGALEKKEALCGPIDHAFMSRFVMVRPTGKPMNDTLGKWASGELEHAAKFWRKVFRGDAPVVDDSRLTDEQIGGANLVLWGDPSSNSVLARILPKLPIKWTEDGLIVGQTEYDAGHHAPILIFPNPLNPERYVVINSGVTFREQALLNNSDQTPKLPDWAVVDLRTPPDAKWPGLVVDAGFFDERWCFR